MFKFTRNQIIAVSMLAVIALAGMVYGFVKSNADKGRITLTEPQAAKAAEAVQSPHPPAEICVHVAGKVIKPGLYKLPTDSRVTDAIKAAGGQLANADLDSINLAEVVTDGQQIYIAPRGEVAPPSKSVVRGGKPSRSDSSKKSESEKAQTAPKLIPGKGTVCINTAGLDELQRLPGIGPALGQNILDYRKEHGRFTSADQLDQVKGIGPKKLAKIRPLVTL